MLTCLSRGTTDRLITQWLFHPSSVKNPRCQCIEKARILEIAFYDLNIWQNMAAAKEKWAVPLLTWKELEAYIAMNEDMANCYPDLRETLLTKIDITPETYGQQLWAILTPLREMPTETYCIIS